jgi:hypothetical protein
MPRLSERPTAGCPAFDSRAASSYPRGAARRLRISARNSIKKGLRGQIRRSPVAVLAIFVALGGGAWAAAKAGPSDIAKDAIRSRHVAPDQVKRSDVNEKSVGRFLGTGVLGGHVKDFGLDAGFSSGGEVVAPLGTSSVIDDAFSMTVSRRLVIQDLHVLLSGGDLMPEGRRLTFTLRRDGNSTPGFSCTIASGEGSCRNTGRHIFQRGQRLSAFAEIFGDGDVEVPDMDILFGYREGT